MAGSTRDEALASTRRRSRRARVTAERTLSRNRVQAAASSSGPADSPPTADSGGRAPPRDGDLTRPDHLDQPERPDQLLERLDLLVDSGDLDRHRPLGHVDHLAAEDVRELHHLAAGLAVG